MRHTSSAKPLLQRAFINSLNLFSYSTTLLAITATNSLWICKALHPTDFFARLYAKPCPRSHYMHTLFSLNTWRAYNEELEPCRTTFSGMLTLKSL
jgi:hypothetical protein